MSRQALPAVWALTRGQRDRTHCVWCGRVLGEDAVPAGVARGYLGPHDLSTPVRCCPDCVAALAAIPLPS